MERALARAGSDKPLDWINIVFLSATPLIAVCGAAWYSYHYGVTWLEIANFLFMFFVTGMGITAGYHRYYAHKTYDCNRGVQLFYLIFGAAAVENSVLNWASDHRYHHQFVDQEEDPYNILKGGFYAHMGWIFRKNTRNVQDRFQNVPDLLRDPLVRWQDRWYLTLVSLAAFGLPACIGLVHGRPMGGLLWGGFLRLVAVQHMTFFINSIAHLWGTQPYSVDNSARDNWWLGPFTFGEGYHNFHHAFQADYRNGIRWYQFDVTKWFLHCLKWPGFVWKLKRAPEPLILAAALKVQMLSVEKKLSAAGAPQRMWDKVRFRMESGRRRLELAMQDYQHAKLEYQRQKSQWSAEARRQWDEKIDACRAEFHDAMERWRDMIRAMNRIPHPSAQGLLTFTALVDILRTKILF